MYVSPLIYTFLLFHSSYRSDLADEHFGVTFLILFVVCMYVYMYHGGDLLLLCHAGVGGIVCFSVGDVWRWWFYRLGVGGPGSRVDYGRDGEGGVSRGGWGDMNEVEVTFGTTLNETTRCIFCTITYIDTHMGRILWTGRSWSEEIGIRNRDFGLEIGNLLDFIDIEEWDELMNKCWKLIVVINVIFG